MMDDDTDWSMISFELPKAAILRQPEKKRRGSDCPAFSMPGTVISLLSAWCGHSRPHPNEEAALSKSAKKAAAPKQAPKAVATAAPKKKMPDVDLGSFSKPAPAAKAPSVAVAPAKPHPRGPIMVVIAGGGTMPLLDNNGRRVMRGEPVEVSKDEVAWLKSGGSEFKLV